MDPLELLGLKVIARTGEADWHAIAIRADEAGYFVRPKVALRGLVAKGFVEEGEGVWRITESGRRALQDASAPQAA